MRSITRYTLFLIPSLLLLVFLVTPELANANPLLDGLDTFFKELAYTIVIGITGIVLWVGGLVFDMGINSFVLGFADTFQNSGIGLAVDGVWVTIRDFVNLLFIFGLVYIGFKMILDSNDSNTRRWLINLIMAALLLNFSLFISKAVVDFSNQISSQIAISGFGAFDKPNVTGNSIKQVDISGQFIKIVGAPKVLGGGAVGENGTPLPEGAGYVYIIGVGITFLIAGFVLFSGGLLLLIRFALLNLFFILSPIMFVGWIIPSLSRFSKDYWDRFLKQAFFAPAYFLMLYIAMEILKALATALSGNPGFNDMQNAWQSTGQATGLSPIPFFILSSIFMLSALTVAQKIGADGSALALNVSHSVRKRVQRGGQFVAANTGGRLIARPLANAAGSFADSTLRRAQQIQGTGRIARATRNFARSNGVQATVSGAATAMQNAKFGLSRTVEEETKMRNQTEKRANNAMAITTGLQAQREKDLAARGIMLVDRGNGKLEEELVANLTAEELARFNDPQTAIDRDERINKMQRLAADLSIKDFEAMSEDQQEQIAEFLSGSLTESIMKSDNISDEQKGKIENAQKAAIEKIIDSNGDIITEKIANLSIRQIETMGDEFINKYAAHFTDSQISDIKKSKKFTENQVGRFAGKRKDDLLDMVRNPATAAQAFEQTTGRDPATGQMKTKPRKTAEIAKLPGDVLAEPNSVKFLTVDVLKAITNNDKGFEQVSMQQREDIFNQLQLQSLTPGILNQKAIDALNYIRSVKGQEEFLGK